MKGAQLSHCYCCGASVATEQQHNQGLKRINKSGMNSRIHHSLPECIAFNQSALRHELHEDVTPSCVDSSEKGLMMVMFCSDLPVKRCEGDRA